MKLKPFGTRDVIRIFVTLLIVIMVNIFVAPYAPWITILTIIFLAYTLSLEFIKFYLGLLKLREKKFKVEII